MNDAGAAPRANVEPRANAEPIVLDAMPAVRADVDAPDLLPSLPGDHPAWQRDVVSVSARVRVMIAALRPLVVRVLTFWDHHVRELGIGGRALRIDASGSYRLHERLHERT